MGLAAAGVGTASLSFFRLSSTGPAFPGRGWDDAEVPGTGADSIAGGGGTFAPVCLCPLQSATNRTKRRPHEQQIGVSLGTWGLFHVAGQSYKLFSRNS